MKKSTISLLSGSILLAGATILAYKKKQKNNYEVLEDTDMRDSTKIDEMESVDAGKDPEEEGLTQLDSAYRAEWVANGFPQTHREMEELKE